MNSTLENYILPIGDKITKNCVMKFYKFYKETQYWPIERLKEYQLQKFTETVDTAYRKTRFYRSLYDKYSLDIKMISSLNDIEQIPIVTKDMLRKNYPENCTIKTGWPEKEYFTSGSSGRPFAVLVDNFTMSAARALMFLRANYSGWEIGDGYLQTGMTVKRGFLKKIKDKALNVKYVPAYKLTDSILDQYLELVETKKLNFIMGYASSIYCIAKRANEINFNRKLKGIVSWGDNLFPHYRSSIENQFQCRVTDSYGIGEGIQVAAQCQFGKYHVFTPHVIIEFLNDGKKCDDSELGEIYLTRLIPGAMPLIRYKVGDIGRPSPLSVCECGRNYDVIEKIEGRDTDIIYTPKGNRLIVHFFTGIFEYETTIDTFQIVQENINSINVKIKPLPGFSKDKWEKIKKQINLYGDEDLRIDMETVKEIPLAPSQKRRFIISKLN
jgi:phenylacetate-CoA ligase